MEQGSRNRQTGRKSTRYVFAGSQKDREGAGLKTCPRCGEVLFADMDVCYGCLYDFSRDERARSEALKRQQLRVLSGRQTQVPSPSVSGNLPDPLDAIELDEIDDDPPQDDLSAPWEEERAQSIPRHSKEQRHSAEETLDLSAASAGTSEGNAKALEADETCLVAGVYKPPKFRVVARSRDMQVKVPLPGQGLTVGRDNSNDIVLFSRTVSRSHLRLVPLDDHVVAHDCGATNPAQAHGEPIEGTVRLVEGEEVEVCGTLLRIETDHPDPAA